MQSIKFIINIYFRDFSKLSGFSFGFRYKFLGVSLVSHAILIPPFKPFCIMIVRMKYDYSYVIILSKKKLSLSYNILDNYFLSDTFWNLSLLSRKLKRWCNRKFKLAVFRGLPSYFFKIIHLVYFSRKIFPQSASYIVLWTPPEKQSHNCWRKEAKLPNIIFSQFDNIQSGMFFF